MTRRSTGLSLATLFLLATGPATLVAQDHDPGAIAAWEKAIRGAEQDQPPPKTQTPPAKTPPAQESPIEPRYNFRDEQYAAPRPGNVTLDPKYAGYMLIPNTPAMIKFNAKPRVDMTMDNQNTGDETNVASLYAP